LNQDQSVGARYTYDPYGRILTSSGALSAANQIRFSSKQWINHGNGSTTVLYYYGYRFYVPELQRWVSRDPIAENAGGNLYAMIYNMPINGVDPMGLEMYGPVLFGPRDGAALYDLMKPCARAVRRAWNLMGQTSNDHRTHCVVSCDLTRNCGKTASELLGNIKESRDLFFGGIQFALSWVSESAANWVEEEFQGGSIEDSALDFDANNFGNAVGVCPSNGDCISVCEKRYGIEPLQ
jgi:RHS repeat-associated protein